jgi:hypothetical protein
VSSASNPTPRKVDYGPWVRIADPGRHVYRTTMDYRRWLLGIISSGGTIAFGWVAYSAATDGILPFGIFIGLSGVVLAVCAILAFIVGVRLTITGDTISVYRRGPFIGTTGTKTRPVEQLAIVKVEPMPTFSRSGMTPIFAVVLVFEDGAVEKLRITFDDRSSVESFVTDLMKSLQDLAGSRCQAELVVASLSL